MSDKPSLKIVTSPKESSPPPPKVKDREDPPQSLDSLVKAFVDRL